MKGRTVSSEEVVKAHLQRIEAVNPKLNAIVKLTAESALSEARAADKALARGEPAGPLHGVPMTVKDSIDTKGVRTTDATKGYANRVPQGDATTVSRMKAAGAILIGKTNYTCLHNLTGWPAVSVRAGTSKEGMPVGVQIAALPFREDLVLAVARQVETTMGGWNRPTAV